MSSERAWFKVNAKKVLKSDMSDEELGLFVRLLALNSTGKYHDEGEIKCLDDIGYVDEQLGHFLKRSRQKWMYWKRILQEKERIVVTASNIIKIVNWKEYQSEYSRQKFYNDLKEVNKLITIEIRDKRLRDLEIIEKTIQKNVRNKELIEPACLFVIWLNCGLVSHRSLTPNMVQKLRSKLDMTPYPNFKKAIQNYALILKSDDYYWDYSWGIDEFCQRGVDKFLDFARADKNYKRDKDGRTGTVVRKYKEPEQYQKQN